MIKPIKENVLKKLIEKIYKADPNKFVLIQVGANDGWMCDRMFDFVNKYDPFSIMIEPVPCYYNILKENYKDNNNVNFENIAIDNKKGKRVMHYIPEKKFSDGEVTFRLETRPELIKEHWARGLGSFYNDRNNIACPELSKYATTAEVQTETISNIFNKYNITKEHNVVIQTDCEGHDLNILNSFDFKINKPLIYISEIYYKIRYPVSHPRYKPHPTKGKIEYLQEGGLYSYEDEKEACDIFTNNGYKLFRSGDMIAISRDITEQL